MGKILVLFDSHGGYTSKMAELIAQGAAEITETEIRLRTVEEASAQDVLWCDGIAVGTPTHCGLASTSMKSFWDHMLEIWGKVDGKDWLCILLLRWMGRGERAGLYVCVNHVMNYGFLVFRRSRLCRQAVHSALWSCACRRAAQRCRNRSLPPLGQASGSVGSVLCGWAKGSTSGTDRSTILIL